MATVADDGGDSATFLGTDDWTNDAEGKAFDVATTCVMVRMKTVNFIIVDFTRSRYRFINNGTHFFFLDFKDIRFVPIPTRRNALKPKSRV